MFVSLVTPHCVFTDTTLVQDAIVHLLNYYNFLMVYMVLSLVHLPHLLSFLPLQTPKAPHDLTLWVFWLYVILFLSDYCCLNQIGLFNLLLIYQVHLYHRACAIDISSSWTIFALGMYTGKLVSFSFFASLLPTFSPINTHILSVWLFLVTW